MRPETPTMSVGSGVLSGIGIWPALVASGLSATTRPLGLSAIVQQPQGLGAQLRQVVREHQQARVLDLVQLLAERAHERDVVLQLSFKLISHPGPSCTHPSLPP